MHDLLEVCQLFGHLQTLIGSLTEHKDSRYTYICSVNSMHVGLEKYICVMR